MKFGVKVTFRFEKRWHKIKFGVLNFAVINLNLNFRNARSFEVSICLVLNTVAILSNVVTFCRHA